MNIYRRTFFAVCPENKKTIAYSLEIATPDDRKIMVEHIDVACALFQPSHHEEIADQFFKQFGGQQVIKASHHGTDIETRRGFDEPKFTGKVVNRVKIDNTMYERGVDVQDVVDHATRACCQ